MYEYFSQLYPRKVREAFFSQFSYFSLSLRKEFVLGAMLFFSVMLTLSFAFQFSRQMFPRFSPFFALLFLFVLSFFLLHLFVYSLISMVASSRGKFIDLVLPDALQLIAANLRAGMTIDRALMAATRPEFGAFNDQFVIVGKEISTGTRIADALRNMTKRVKSEKFERSVKLIVTGMESGGELSRLLSEVAENLVHQKTIEDKVKASVSTYLIFIGSAAGFAAPILYGLSTAIVTVIVDTFSSVDIPPGANVPFTIQMSDDTAELLPDFVMLYTRVSMLTLCVMACFVLGLINKGDMKYGLKYIPFLVGCGMAVYFGVSLGANALFNAIL